MRVKKTGKILLQQYEFKNSDMHSAYFMYEYEYSRVYVMSMSTAGYNHKCV